SPLSVVSSPPSAEHRRPRFDDLEPLGAFLDHDFPVARHALKPLPDPARRPPDIDGRRLLCGAEADVHDQRGYAERPAGADRAMDRPPAASGVLDRHGNPRADGRAIAGPADEPDRQPAVAVSRILEESQGVAI